jgi:cell division protein FtsI/penicillin-binding protein 2
MNKKNVIIIGVAIVTVAVVAVGAVLAFVFILGSVSSDQEILDTLNNNQQIVRDITSEYEQILDTTQLPVESAGPEEYLTFTQTAISDLEELRSNVEDKKSEFQEGPNEDTQEIYTLYTDFADQVSIIIEDQINITREFQCYFDIVQTSQSTFIETERLFSDFESTNDTTTLASVSRQLGTAFSTFSSDIVRQNECFTEFTSNSKAPEILESLGSEYDALADAIEANNESELEAIGERITTLLSDPAISGFDSQYDLVFIEFELEIETSLAQLNETTAAIDSKFDEIAEKYGFEIEIIEE